MDRNAFIAWLPLGCFLGPGSILMAYFSVEQNALAFVELLISSPFKLNPLLSVAMIWMLAYLVHGYRAKVITDVETARGKDVDLANGRALTERSSAENDFVGVLNGCHINGLEAFSAYSATICMALLVGVDKEAMRGYAAIYVLLRVVYTCVYLSPFNGLPRTFVYSFSFFFIWSMMITAATVYDM